MTGNGKPPQKPRKLGKEMVRRQIAARGISDPRVLAVMRDVPRARFVPPDSLGEAYADHPLPIGDGQTISQPYMVALMLECLRLRGHERVLEIGTGSGYQTALLAELCAEVYTIERIAALAEVARDRLSEMGCANVHTRIGDGTLGWPEEAPFDGIIVSAAAPRVPPPLLEQLAAGGRMAIPVGGVDGQELIVAERAGKSFRETRVCGCIFVKLVGEEGW